MNNCAAYRCLYMASPELDMIDEDSSGAEESTLILRFSLLQREFCID